jgi:hypothetical protein
MKQKKKIICNCNTFCSPFIDEQQLHEFFNARNFINDISVQNGVHVMYVMYFVNKLLVYVLNIYRQYPKK